MKEIRLSNGMVTMVDDNDYESLRGYLWFYGSGYAQRKEAAIFGRKTISMHVQIMNTPKGMETDHIDGNGLNNQRSNLRICTCSQNKMNRGCQTNNTSGYKGVYFRKQTKKWVAQIRVNKKYIYLGSFDTPVSASAAYDAAAVKYCGDFSRTNA